MEYYLIIFFILFLAADAALIFFVFYRRKKDALTVAEKKKFRLQWEKIRIKDDLRHAVVEADILLQLVLKRKGYAGSLGQQLKLAEKLFKDVNAVWAAHKLRNRVAHELDLKFSDTEGKKALSSFEKALRELGAF